MLEAEKAVRKVQINDNIDELRVESPTEHVGADNKLGFVSSDLVNVLESVFLQEIVVEQEYFVFTKLTLLSETRDKLELKELVNLVGFFFLVVE